MSEFVAEIKHKKKDFVFNEGANICEITVYGLEPTSEEFRKDLMEILTKEKQRQSK